jgi:competence protein ComEA
MLFSASEIRADKKNPPAHPIDLNTATAQQLQQVPGIGPGTAKAIVNFRLKSGPFRKIEDLLAIKGVSKARLEKMRPYLTVNPDAQKSP